MLFQLNGNFLGRLVVTLYHGSHINLHLLEIVNKFALDTILDMAHLLSDLLLQRSVAL